MIRNLKVLGLAALALAAFGAFSASGAQAAHEFNCSVNPCVLKGTQDGTGSTGHQVFIVENAAKTEVVSFTCHEIVADGERVNATDAKTTKVEYKTCTVNGSSGVTVDMNSCNYTFTAGAAGTEDLAKAHVVCEGTKKIKVNIAAIGCTFEIPAQEVTGIGYHSEGTTPNRNVTLTAKAVTVTGVSTNAGCNSLIASPATGLTGTYTTGNVTVTGQSSGGAMADLWFA